MYLWNKFLYNKFGFASYAKKFIVPFVFLLVWGCDSERKASQHQSEGQESISPEVVESVTPPRPEDWHTFMHNLEFSGISPDKRLSPPLELLWKFKTGGPLHASPVIANGTLYIGSTDGKLYALDAKQWNIKWVFDAGDAIRYSATVLGNRVYFSARNNKVYALDAETGSKLWEYKTKSWTDAPLIVADNKVYIGAFPSKIYLLNARTGKLEAMRERTVRIQNVEYGCANGVFRPVYPKHNAKLWRGETGGSESYPVMANGTVYIGGRDGKIHGFDSASKTETWVYQTGGFVDAAPAISDGILYAASGDGYVYAFTNASEVGNLASGNRAIDTQRHGVVTRDAAPVYATKGGMSVLLHLNDGVQLPIVQVSEGLYEIELPNGVRGWMDALAFGEFEDIDGILFNSTLCRGRDDSTVSLRRLQLIEGAEFPRWSPRWGISRVSEKGGPWW